MDFYCFGSWGEQSLLAPMNKNMTECQRFQFIKYESELASAKEAMAAVGMITDKKTHLWRGVLARMLAEMGVSLSQIAQHQIWDLDAVMLKKYITSLPVEATLGAAGMWGFQQRYYICPRTELEPPEELRSLIFPFIDEHLAAIIDHPDHYQKPLSTGLFLQVLAWFRDVLLQVRSTPIGTSRANAGHLQ